MGELDQARGAKDAAREQLLAIPGVHAVGVGPKWVAGQPTSVPAVIVFVVKKKPLSEIPLEERIPSQVGGVQTDVIESAMPVPQLDPIDLENVDDDDPYEPLRGGIQVQVGTAGYVGTMGCLGTFPEEPEARIVGLTNWHVVGTPLGLTTRLSVTATKIGPSFAIEFESFNEDDDPIQEVEQKGSVVFLTLRIDDSVYDFFVQTADGDTISDVAEKLAQEINADPNPNFSATFSGPITTVTPSGGVLVINSTDVFAGGPSVTDLSASLIAKVVGPVITLSGFIDDEFYGVYTTVNTSGAQHASQGVFTRLEKGQSLEDAAAAIVASLAKNAVSATHAGSVVTIAASDQVECCVWRDTRVGQSENNFSSSCCGERIGRVIDARFGLDVALIQLDPKLKYIADVKGVGHLTGSRALEDHDVMASLVLHKRGRTTGLRRGHLLSINTDGLIAASVPKDPKKRRFQPRRYLDAMTIQAVTTDPPFSAGGDSGSAIVHVDGTTRDVVGVLFGGPPDGFVGSTVATAIQPVLDAFGITIKPAATDNDVQVVPEVQGGTLAPPIPANRTLGPARKRLREVAGEFEASPRGRRYVEMVRRHVSEAANLVNHNRRVGVEWQRQGGPLLMRAVIDCVEARDRAFPREVGGKPVDACILAIGSALRAHGSPALVADLDQFMQMFHGVGGSTYAEVLGRLDTARHAQQSVASVSEAT